MIEFKPEYDRKPIIAYVVAILLSVGAIYFFIDSGYKELNLLGFPLLMIAYFIIYTKYIAIKNIIFDDFIHVERFLWRDIVIRYDKIEHVTFANLKAGRKFIIFQGIINEDELLKILNDKINEGKINIDNAKNKTVATKQYININFGIILFLLLVIIQGISSVFPYHFINSIIDGFIVWIFIYLIYQFIIDRKFH